MNSDTLYAMSQRLANFVYVPLADIQLVDETYEIQDEITYEMVKNLNEINWMNYLEFCKLTNPKVVENDYDSFERFRAQLYGQIVQRQIAKRKKTPLGKDYCSLLCFGM